MRKVGVPLGCSPKSQTQSTAFSRPARYNLSVRDPTTNGFTTTSDYILGPGGEQAAEMSVSVSGGATTVAWSHTNVYAAGKLLATYDLTGKGLHFYLDDPLGTRRAQTEYAGVLEQTCQSLPFGDALNCTGSITAPTEHHFTGKERDTESGNDYFGARYYNSAMGRFMSPDPLPWIGWQNPVEEASEEAKEESHQKFENWISNPQNFNLNAYVMNNPLGFIDPLGLSSQCIVTKTTTTWDSSTFNPDTGKTITTVHVNVSESTYCYSTGNNSQQSKQSGPGQNNAPSSGPTNLTDALERAGNCAKAYYGIANIGKWGAIAAGAGGISKSVPKALGLRVFIQPGGSEYTSALSILSLASGGGGVLRVAANFASKWAGPIAIASAIIDAGTIAACTISY